MTTGVAMLCVAIACKAPAPAGIARHGAAIGPAPASLRVSDVAQQLSYPRVVRIDTVDAATVQWLRANLANYYPSILKGDTSFMFVSLYVDDRGYVVGAAAQPLPRGVSRADAPAFLYANLPFSYADTASAGAPASLAAEARVFASDRDTVFRGMMPTRSVLGMRTVLPRSFMYDTVRGTSIFDPYLGADPHAFQRDDDLYLKPSMLAPSMVEVHVLTLAPGRGGPADFGHHFNVLTEPTAPASANGGPMGSLANPDAGWIMTPEIWDTLSRKPAVLIDGVPRKFADVIAMTSAHDDSILDIRKVPRAEAMQLTRDPAAVNGAIVVTTKGHRSGIVGVAR